MARIGRRSLAETPAYHRPVAQALPKNAELAAQFDLLADLMEIQGRDSFRVGAYRAAADADPRDVELGRAARARRAGEGAAGDRQDDRGEDRAGDRDRRGRGAHQAQVGGAARGRDLHPAAGARAEDGAAALAGARDHDGRRPARGGRGAASCARWPASGRSSRSGSWSSSPSRRRPRSRTARCSGTRCRSCATVEADVAAHPAAVQVVDRRLGAALPRDGARPRPDRDRDRRAAR